MADGAATGLPASNRGVSGFREDDQPFRVLLDWFSASVDLPAVLRETGWDRSMKDTLDTLDATGSNACALASVLCAFFFGGSGIQPHDEVRAGRFYAWRVSLRNGAGEHVGLIEMGGPHTVRKDGVYTARLELTGDGCRLYEGAAGSGHAKRWLELRAKLESSAGRITRVDVAADDLHGFHPITWAICRHQAGEFDNRGQTPKAQHIDDFGSGDGSTFYIGSVTSEKRMRVYEKGKQLGDRESPWVRYEVQFTASNRKELPLDLLRDPANYLLGAYPVLRFLQAMATRIDVTNAAAVATLKSCRRHLKRQYGATLHFIVKHTRNDAELGSVIRSLTSPKLPDWASNSTGVDWPEIHSLITSQEINQ
ncbi:replication initiation factor domain-containing protein [Lysobacter brunescens]|uniref:Replication initiation factor domain-containing protein n=1 Tax=Lysobacter brunescens TaxID=262323 RepID=A0ABW2YEU7_9GAMM